jgi:hypothetical protein
MLACRLGEMMAAERLLRFSIETQLALAIIASARSPRKAPSIAGLVAVFFLQGLRDSVR